MVVHVLLMAFAIPQEEEVRRLVPLAEPLTRPMTLLSAARVASAAATPKLIDHLQSAAVTATLRSWCSRDADACARSGVMNMTAAQLLDMLRARVADSEVLHVFGTDLESDIDRFQSQSVLHNTWMNAVAYGNDTSEPISCNMDNIECRLLGCAPFTGPSMSCSHAGDTVGKGPLNLAEARARPHYCSLNMLSSDFGAPRYGAITAVLNQRLFRDSDALALFPMDTGDFMVMHDCVVTGRCGVSAKEEVVVNSTRAGVVGALDHVVLKALQAHPALYGVDLLDSFLRSWFPPTAELASIDMEGARLRENTYIEAELFGEVPLSSDGIKLLIADAPSLFGTRAGAALQRAAIEKHIPLAWAAQEGGIFNRTEYAVGVTTAMRAASRLPRDSDLASTAAAFPSLGARVVQPRLLDLTVLSQIGCLNTSGFRNASATDSFSRVWDASTPTIAGKGGLAARSSDSDFWSLWGRLRAAIPHDCQLRPLVTRACADMGACVGTNLMGDCVCAA